MTYLDYFSTIFECLCIMFVCKSYLKNKIRLNIFEYAIIISDIIIINIIINNATYSTFLIGQLTFFLVCLINTNKISDTVFLSMLSFITIFLCQIIMSVPVACINVLVTDEHLIGLIGNILTLLILWVLMKHLKPLYLQVIATTFTYKVALTSFYIILVSLLSICQNNMDYLYSNAVLFLAIIGVIIISNVLLLYYEKVISTKNMNIEYYEKYLPVYENLINDIRANQHEFNNRIQALQILCDSQDNDNLLAKQLKEYTASYSKPFHAYTLLSLNNPLFVASLYSMYLDAQAQNITINFDVSCQELHSNVSEITLTDLSSILIHNAIEASRPYDCIYVSISCDAGVTTVEVRNTVDHLFTDNEISNFFSSDYSTKNDSVSNKRHGYGLYYLKKQIIQHKGSLLATCINHNKKNWMIFRLTV